MTEEPRTVEDEATGDSDEEANAGKKVVRLSVGQEMTGTIKQVTEFGAFVDIGAGRDGLVHISELSVGAREQCQGCRGGRPDCYCLDQAAE